MSRTDSFLRDVYSNNEMHKVLNDINAKLGKGGAVMDRDHNNDN